MKQVELLDLILKALYETSSKGGEIVQLLKGKGIEVSLDDAHRLGRRLADAGYVKFNATRDSALVDMKSEGIEFVEGDSFTQKGHSIINNNYTISSSPNANIVSHSSQVSINQTDASKAKQILAEIRDVIATDSTVDEARQDDSLECVQEIEDGINNGKAPKFAVKSFLEMSSNTASSISLGLQLADLLTK